MQEESQTVSVEAPITSLLATTCRFVRVGVINYLDSIFEYVEVILRFICTDGFTE